MKDILEREVPRNFPADECFDHNVHPLLLVIVATELVFSSRESAS